MAQTTYHVEGMDCADCALKVEKGVQQLDGVKSVQVNFMTGLLQVEGAVNGESIRKRVTALGYQLAEAGEKPALPAAAPESSAQRDSTAAPGTGFVAALQPIPCLGSLVRFLAYLLKRSETRLALAAGALLVIAMVAGWLGAPALLVTLLELAALALAGYPIARSGIANLVINRDFSINLLMTIAAVGAVAIGQMAEGATLIFLFAVAEAMEAYTTDRARSVLSDLTELAPSHAIRIRRDFTPGAESGMREERVPVGQLQVGDCILVKPGERVPMDGVVARGDSDVDQAPITGESMPVSKTAGNEVFAGTVNGSGVLEVDVTRLVADNTLSRIIHLVEQAQGVRAPVQRFIDQFARVYTPAMVVVAGLVAILPPLLFREPFFNTPAGEHGWFYRALSLLVIACPCALVISAPVTILSAITAAARRGVLFKGGVFMEMLSKVKAFAFDKTGTLTSGQPQMTLCRSTECSEGDVPCQHCDEVLGLAYALEQRSTHPLAKAVVTAAEARGLNSSYAPAEGVVNLAGRGLQGNVGGQRITVGSHTLFDAEHPHEARLCAWAEAAELEGQTAMLVSDGQRVHGLITVADQVRSDSRAAVLALHDQGIATVMLTGDNPGSAQRVAELTGIESFYAGLLPEKKVGIVQHLKEQYGAVAMVGDGINDTPALAAASIGISLRGAGSAQALETADVVLMGDDLAQLPYAVKLSAFANRLIRANVVISLGTKLVFMALALAGVTSMWMAVAADMGVSLLVTLNGLRAFRFTGE